MESFESKPESQQERIKKFGNVLLSEGLAVEVRIGLHIDAKDYEYTKGDQFAVDDTKGVICRFLALPMYIDDFISHEVRITSFNEASAAGKLPADFSELYFLNKLRTNRLSSVVRSVETLGKMRANPAELNSFIKEQAQTLSLANYAELSVSDKLAVVGQIEQLAVNVLNKMLEIGVISGSSVSV